MIYITAVCKNRATWPLGLVLLRCCLPTPCLLNSFVLCLVVALFACLLQVIPVNQEEVKEQQQEIEAAKEAALEASTSEEEFVPENVPEHLVQSE